MLDHRMGNTAIEVKPAAISRTRRGLVPIGYTPPDDDTISLITPDAHRSVPDPRHIPTVIGSRTPLDQNLRTMPAHDPVPTMVRQVRRITGVVIGTATHDPYIPCTALIDSLHR